ncbi:MAG: hypothetical protein A2019_05880 [Sulfurimonas sp. GWF2_37_8]|nr:MAG: hypothetical protein A2019_05880 [Sulfurimonas sp. GWF2_37_8]
MSLINIFNDYIVNKKSLKHYIEVRKTLNERGEFNDALLAKAQDNLDRLKSENEAIYDGMYEVLYEIIKRDEGYHVEYPINFTREVLKLYEHGNTPQKVYEEYKRSIEHHGNNA